MAQSTCRTPRLSPLDDKPIPLGFDGADMSSDAGLTLLREIERKAGLARRLADCRGDPRDPAKVQHILCDIIRFRIMMIATGYEDRNDAASLRYDPSFKLALERDPETGAALYSQPTISRMENLPDMRALVRMGREMVRFYCQSFARAPGQKFRRFKTFSYAARSWTKPRVAIVARTNVARMATIARVQVSPMGRDTRYIVTNLEGGRGKHLYEKPYSARGQAENHIKAWKTHLASDRISCSKATANQMRMMLHGAAYWFWWKLRAACPGKSPWRRAQFDTLRLHLVRLAATIVEKKTRIIVTLPASCPQQGLLRLLFDALAPPKTA